METSKMVECPQCYGRGKLFDARLIGGRGTPCGFCSGRKQVTAERAEAFHDTRPITQGDAKALITAAVAAVRVEMADAIATAIDKHQARLDETEEGRRYDADLRSCGEEGPWKK